MQGAYSDRPGRPAVWARGAMSCSGINPERGRAINARATAGAEYARLLELERVIEWGVSAFRMRARQWLRRNEERP